MQFIKIMQTLMLMLPTLINVVRQVQELFPQKELGPQKLELVKQMTEAAHQADPDTNVDFDQLWPAVRRVIEGILTLVKSDAAAPK